jgi:dienelactone hydrolase
MFRRGLPALLTCLTALIVTSSALGAATYGSSTTVPDPTTLGAYTPVNADYSDGTVQLGTDAENFPVRIAGDVWYPAQGSGPFPVIVFLHGQHEYCEFDDPTGLSGTGGEGGGTVSAVLQTGGDELSTYDQGQCESEVPLGLATSTEINSYEGYDYMGQELASDGYVVFSIDVNDISSLSESADDASYIGRAELVAKTLDFANALNTGALPMNPLSMALEGRLNMAKIGLMGHSRGGQGINLFGVYDQERPATYAAAEALPVPQGNEDYGPQYPISALFALAPVDGQGDVAATSTTPAVTRDAPTPVGMPYATLLPLCDGDVFDLEGDPPFEREKYLNTAAGYPSIEYAVNGADHDFFNTEWSDDDADPATGGIGEGTEDTACGNEQLPSRLSRTEERAVGATIIDAFMRYFVGGEHQFAPIVDGQAFPAAECPAARAVGIGITCDTVVETSYIAPEADRLDLVHPDSATVLPTQTVGGDPVTFTGFESATACTPTAGEEDLTTSGCGSSPDRDRGPQLDLAWSGPATMAMSLGSTGTDVSGYADFTMRAATDYLSELNVPLDEPDFDVVLTDAAGKTASVDVDPYSGALVPSPGTTSRKVVLTGIVIPLSEFSGVDLTHITSVTLSFGSASTTGEIQASDIGFTNMLPSAPVTVSTETGTGTGTTTSTTATTAPAAATTPISVGPGLVIAPPEVKTHPSAATCSVHAPLSFDQHPQAPVREIKAVLEINGKTVKTIRGSRITRVTFTRPKASRFTLLIVATLSDGEVVAHRLSYTGCIHGAVHTVVRHRVVVRVRTR